MLGVPGPSWGLRVRVGYPPNYRLWPLSPGLLGGIDPSRKYFITQAAVLTCIVPVLRDEEEGRKRHPLQIISVTNRSRFCNPNRANPNLLPLPLPFVSAKQLSPPRRWFFLEDKCSFYICSLGAQLVFPFLASSLVFSPLGWERERDFECTTDQNTRCENGCRC